MTYTDPICPCCGHMIHLHDEDGCRVCQVKRGEIGVNQFRILAAKDYENNRGRPTPPPTNPDLPKGNK